MPFLQHYNLIKYKVFKIQF